jgi:hypothetical protein
MAAGDITVLSKDVQGTQCIVYGTIEMTAGTHPAGGLALNPAKFGLSAVDFVSFETVELAATTALVARYDRATDKVTLHEGDGPTTAGPLAETNEDTTAATEIRFKAEGQL